MGFVSRDVDRLINDLGANIALMTKHLEAKGVDLEKVDGIVHDAAVLIQDRALLIDCGAHNAANITNTVVMVLMHAALKMQEDVISAASLELGVTRDVLVDELMNEMVWGSEARR